MLRRTLAGLVVIGLSPAGAVAAPPSGVALASGLIAHRAIYDLELKDASERSGISDMAGRMVYEFSGNYCEGFTTNFRFVTEIETGESKKLSDQQTTTYENIRDRSFTFETKSFTDEQLDKQVNGRAQTEQDGVKVDLRQPQEKALTLAESRFPTEHMIDVIDNAKQGKRLFEARVFDGSDEGDKAMVTTTVVGAPEVPKADETDAANAGDFAKSVFWPVTIAYFNEGDKTDSVPVYRMSFKLYENGITRDLTMDYGDFVLSGKLSKLELLDKKASTCK